jgi:hypothetical protein
MFCHRTLHVVEKKPAGQRRDICHIHIILYFHAELVSLNFHVRLKTTDVLTLCRRVSYINVTVT